MLCIRPQNLIYLTAGSFTLWRMSAQFRHLATPDSHHSTRHFYEFGFFFFLKIPHISENIQYLFFSVWYISLTITLSKSINVVARGRISFCGWIIYVYVWLTLGPHCLELHSLNELLSFAPSWSVKVYL